MPISPEPAKPKRRRKILHEETLVDAVIAVGFRSLTVEAVAAELDIAHSAIYHHVKNREALVELAMNHIMRREVWPAPGPDWRAYLAANSQALWDLLGRHPGLALELTAQTAHSSALGAFTDTLTAHLEMLGFTPDHAHLAADLVVDLPFDVAMRAHYYAGPHSSGELWDGIDEWFVSKLTVVLAGIAVELAP